jgi:hypothetical protein
MPEDQAQPDLRSVMVSGRYLVLLALAAVVGVVASFAAWCFLELMHEAQHGIYHSLPDTFGYDSPPEWWPLPFLALAGVVVALALVKLLGTGGHAPAHGLDPSSTQPIELPGVLLAALAGVAFGAGTVAALRLPLSAVVLATVLTSPAGLGVAPLIVVGVTVAYLTTLALHWTPTARAEPAAS